MIVNLVIIFGMSQKVMKEPQRGTKSNMERIYTLWPNKINIVDF